jgi:hypothetical protein
VRERIRQDNPQWSTEEQKGKSKMTLRTIWERVGTHPWRLAVLFVGFAIMLDVVLPLLRPLLGITCDAEEKAALLEFPQYGGKEAGKNLEIFGDEVNLIVLQELPPGCALEEFAAPHASPKQVAEYYEKKLTERGWTVTVKRYPAAAAYGIGIEVVGNREGLHYDAYSFQSAPGSKLAEIRVSVYRP